MTKTSLTDNKQEQYINTSGLILNDKILKEDCKIIHHFNGTPVIVKTDYGMGEIIYSSMPFYSPMLSEVSKNDNIHKELFSHNNRPYQKRKLYISQSLSETVSIWTRRNSYYPGSIFFVLPLFILEV